MSSKRVLYGSYASPPVRAVILTLKELNLDFELKLMQPSDFSSAEFLKINPQHTVPTLVDDGKTLWDSHAIMAYLVRKYAKNDTLYPNDCYKRAVVDQRSHYENGILFTSLLRRIAAPIFAGTMTRQKLAEEAKAIYEAYDLLEIFLADNKFITGNTMTVADFSIETTTSSLAFLAPIDAKKHKKLAAYMERMKQLPYYTEAIGDGYTVISNTLKTKIID